MNVVWEALRNTPWWMYLLFWYLLVRGLRAGRSGLVSPGRLAVLPVFILVWSGWSLMTLFPVNALTLGAWAISMVSGAAVGALLAQDLPIRADRGQGRLWCPGDRSALALVMALFATKYVARYLLYSRPGIVDLPIFYFTDIVVSGLVTGVFLGRLATVLHKYRTVPSEALD